MFCLFSLVVQWLLFNRCWAMPGKSCCSKGANRFGKASPHFRKSCGLPPIARPPTARLPGCLCGNLGIGKSISLRIGKSKSLGPGHLGIWKPTKSKTIKFSQSKYTSAQNVGKVWISRNKHILTLLQAISNIFAWAKNAKTAIYVAYMILM